MSVIEDFLHSFSSNDAFKLFNAFMQEPIFIAVAILLTLATFFSLKKSEQRKAVLLSLLLAGVLVSILKQLYADPRPCAGLPGCEDGYGFPSAHSTIAFAIASHTFGMREFYFFLVLAVLIALSRVVAGVHSFPQVVAGAVLGFAISTSVAIFLQWANNFKRRFK